MAMLALRATREKVVFQAHQDLDHLEVKEIKDILGKMVLLDLV